MGKKFTDFFKLNIIKGDLGLWMIYFFLCMISIVTMYSASSRLSFDTGRHWVPLMSHVGYLLIGFCITVLVSKIPCKYFKLVPIVGIPVVVVLLVYALFLKSDLNESHSAHRWISLFGVNFQPSELAKTMLILATAVILSKLQKEEKVQTKKGMKNVVMATKGGYSKAFTMIMWLAVIICGLIVPENFSTAMMLALVIFIMMIIGNVPRKLLYRLVGVMAILGALFVTVLMITPDETLGKYKRALTWKNRIQTAVGIIDEDVDSQEYKDKTWQEDMSKVAIASSGITGVGVGNSVSRDFLPHAESDFIYSIIIEEMGVAGAVFVLLLFVMLIIRVGRVAQKCDRFFPAFLVIGLGLMMVIQALVNMSVAVGLMPVTGQTLPLISHGGTSIMIMSANFGMILSISRYASKANGEKKAVTKELKRPVIIETGDVYSSVGMV